MQQEKRAKGEKNKSMLIKSEKDRTRSTQSHFWGDYMAPIVSFSDNSGGLQSRSMAPESGFLKVLEQVVFCLQHLQILQKDIWPPSVCCLCLRASCASFEHFLWRIIWAVCTCEQCNWLLLWLKGQGSINKHLFFFYYLCLDVCLKINSGTLSFIDLK